MAKINASIAAVSTDFKPWPTDLYEFEVKEIKENEKNGETQGVSVISECIGGPGEYQGKKFSEYCGFVNKKGEVNEMGIASLKKYFEAKHGKDVVKGWSDDDYDTDDLLNFRWRGQIEIYSYTPNGETESKEANRVKRMEKI